MVTAAAQGAGDEPASQVRRHRRSWAAAVGWRSRRLVWTNIRRQARFHC